MSDIGKFAILMSVALFGFEWALFTTMNKIIAVLKEIRDRLPAKKP